MTKLTPDHQRPHAGYLQRPQVIIDADAGRVGKLRQRRIRQPAGARELADHQRNIDQQRARRGQPETDRVQRRKRHVADAKLQRHDEIHQPDHERHGNEENHQRAVCREDLIVVIGRQVAVGVECQGLLRAHHDRVGEAAQQHHHREHDVHDPDALVVNAGDPLGPQIRQPTLQRDPAEDGDDADDDQGPPRTAESADRTEWQPSSACPTCYGSARGDTLGLGRPACGPGPGGSFCETICWNRSGSAAR